MPATIVKGDWADALEPIAKKSFFLGLGREYKQRIEMYFGKQKSDKLTETYLEHGDIGTVPEFTGELEYEGVQQGYKSTITNKLYAKGMRIEYRFIRTDQLNIVKSLPKLLGLAMRRRLGSDGTAWFNDMFSSAYPTRDTLSLVNAAHTSAVGGATQSNRITTAFGPVALTAAKITMRKFQSNRNNPLEIMPTLLFGAVDLDDAFAEVINSQGQVGTANNTINVHKGKWTAITDIHFSDTNNWAIADKELMKEFQVWQTVDEPSFDRIEDFDGLVSKYRVVDFHGYGSNGWEWILASEVD